MLIPIFSHLSDPSARLSDAERLYFVSQAIDASVDAIAFTDIHGRISFVNCAFVRTWGYQRPADVGGRLLSSFVEPDRAPDHAPASLNVCSNWTGEALGVASNGRRFPIAGSITRIDDPSGGLAGFVASFRDVSDRARAEQALRESEERYRSLVESARDTIFTSDIDGRFLYVNTAAAAALGLRPDQVEGRTVDELFPPPVAARYRSGVRQVIETGKTLATEDLSEVNGEVRWYSTIVQPMADNTGQVVAQAIVRDITTSKLAEERLTRSEERLNQAIRVAEIGFFDHDHLKAERYWSPELRRIAGLGADDPLPAHPSTDGADSVLWIHPEDRTKIVAAVQRAHAPQSDGFYDVEYRFFKADGEQRWLKVRSQTFFRGEGDARHPVRTVGGALDITAWKTAEADRIRLQEQLTQAQKMESVGRLAGGVAHDFNNMLSVISGHAELALHAAAPDAAVRTDLEEIRAAARRAADLTRQLLAFARRQVVAPKVLDLNAAVSASLGMLRRLIGEDIELNWTPQADAGRVRIDPSQLDQVLTNLIANARDAIAGVGRVSVLTAQRNVRCNGREHCNAELAPGPFAVLEVRDTGHGMTPETVAHLFEPFFTTKPVGQGTGLGLATVYGIVKQNDGCIEVDSELGRGTTVRIFLPSVEADVTGATTDMPAGLPQSGHETVLLVEDESAVLRLSKIVLERFGYTVLTAGTPSEAIQLFQHHEGRVHLLVTDVVMPEMNGRELAARLRETRPELKALFVSGYSASALAPRGVLDEGVHFLQKPFSLEDLASSVREALDAR